MEEAVRRREGRQGIRVALLTSVLLAALGPFAYGIGVAQLNVPAFSDVDGCEEASDEKCVVFPGHSQLQWVMAVSSWVVGGCLGAVGGFVPADAYGRKKTILASSVMIVAGGLLNAFSWNIAALILGRFVSGVPVGFAVAVVPMYIGEISPPSVRGIFGISTQFGIVLGILLANSTAFVFDNETLWRFQAGLPVIPGLVQVLLGVSFMVESPRWLANTYGDMGMAEQEFRKLADPAVSDGEMRQLIGAGRASSVVHTGGIILLREFLLTPRLRLGVILSVLLPVLQQWCGINGIFFYSAVILEGAGLKDVRVGIVILGLVNTLATAASFPLIERLGRRPLLLASCVGMVVFLSTATLSFALDWGYGALISVSFFIIFFEIGVGPIPFFILSEIMPERTRAIAQSVMLAINYAAAFVVSVVFPFMADGLGDYSLVPFVAAVLILFPWVYTKVPETKGKSLDQLQFELGFVDPSDAEISSACYEVGTPEGGSHDFIK